MKKTLCDKEIWLKSFKVGVIVLGITFFPLIVIDGLPVMKIILSSISSGGLAMFYELARAYGITINKRGQVFKTFLFNL